MKTKILIPIYNDWQSVFKLLENIDLQLDSRNAEVSVLIINDASTEKKPNNNFVFKNLKSVKIINLKVLEVKLIGKIGDGLQILFMLIYQPFPLI